MWHCSMDLVCQMSIGLFNNRFVSTSSSVALQSLNRLWPSHTCIYARGTTPLDDWSARWKGILGQHRKTKQTCLKRNSNLGSQRPDDQGLRLRLQRHWDQLKVSASNDNFNFLKLNTMCILFQLISIFKDIHNLNNT